MRRLVALHRTAALPAGGLASGDLLLAGGRGTPAAAGAGRVLTRDELCSVAEWSELSAAVVATLRAWIDGERGSGPEGFPSAEAAGGGLLVRCLQAAKAGLLIARALEKGTGVDRLAIAEGWIAARDAAGSLDLNLPVDSIGCRRPARLAALACRLRWGRVRRRPVRSRKTPVVAEGAVLGLETPRLTPLLDELDADGISLSRLGPLAENRFLPESNDAPPAATGDAVRSWRSALDRFPEVPPAPSGVGFDLRRLLRDVLSAAGPAEVIEQATSYAAWRGWLRRHRPRLLLGPPPWAGDLRGLALAARVEGTRYVTVQDGAMSPLGQGGLLPPDRALCWGEAGRQWFLAQGYEPQDVLVAADPGLEALRKAVASLDPADARSRLGLPAKGRLLLAGLSNSAPHTLVFEEDDPLLRLRRVALALGGQKTWRLVVKPHPRLPRVDGWSRIAEGRAAISPVNGRLVDPATEIPLLLAACDAYVGEGDTLTLEALACGLPALLWEDPAIPAPYPDFLEGGLPAARTGGELRDFLSRARMPGGEGLLRRYYACHPRPAEILAGWIEG